MQKNAFPPNPGNSGGEIEGFLRRPHPVQGGKSGSGFAKNRVVRISQLIDLISMIMETQDLFRCNGHGLGGAGKVLKPPMLTDEAAFGYPRDFLANQFVYLVVSPRARGLSVGVNLNPVVNCTFNCMYCEVDRTKPSRAMNLDVERMVQELRTTLLLAHEGGLRAIAGYAQFPEDLLAVRHVTLSGDGEPTIAGNFVEATEAIIHLRALGQVPPFKIVLVTNSTALDQPQVQRGLKYLTKDDEVWAKLDAGTQRYLSRVNGTNIPIEKILANILGLARRRPVVIQSLFPSIHRKGPSSYEIEQYARRLNELSQQGANISMVQI